MSSDQLRLAEIPRRRRKSPYGRGLGAHGECLPARPAGEQTLRRFQRWARRLQRKARAHETRVIGSVLLVGLLGAVVAWQGLRAPDPGEQTLAWTPPGVSHDGIPLPNAHRLAAPLPPDDDPTASPALEPWSHPSTAGLPEQAVAQASTTPGTRASSGPAAPIQSRAAPPQAPVVAGLSIRFGCAWGDPGRNPYRGTPEQVLAALQLPPSLVHAAAQRIRAGDRTDRITITSTSIRRHSNDIEYDAQGIAMSFGRSLCLDTRVNFAPGHREMGDLYEVTADGRQVTVIVPDVCGNVSVLSVDGRSPVALIFADAQQQVRSVPVGGTLGHVLLGLGLAAALRRRR